MRKMLAILALLAAVILPAGRAASPAAAQAAPVALSAEEAAVRLMPYLLTPQDFGDGYAQTGVNASGPSDDALSTANPAQTLARDVKDGLVVYLYEDFAATNSTLGLPTIEFNVELRQDKAAAAAWATGGPETYTPQDPTDAKVSVTLPATIGDASSAVRGTDSPPQRPGTAYYAIRWQRGQFGFSLWLEWTPGNEQLDPTVAMAERLDARLAALPPLDLSNPVTTAPASEQQRFDIGLKTIAPLAPGDADAPSGYTLEATGYPWFHPTWDAVNAAQPAAALNLLDGTWKRLMKYNQDFTGTTPAGQRVRLTASISADADAAAAQADATGSFENVGQSLTAFDPGIQVGDVTAGYRGTSRGADGRTNETLEIDWSHGPLEFAVQSSGPSGSTSLTAVLALVRNMEAKYQAAGVTQP